VHPFVTVYELHSDLSLGYWSGVKQPLGSYKNGMSIHQLSRGNWPEPLAGNPDNILWVRENDPAHGVEQDPTGLIDGWFTHPGGVATFAEDGSIWYTIGARAGDLPLDLLRSDVPFDQTSFSMVLDDYVTGGANTTPCLEVNDPNLMLFWRRGYSAGTETTVRFRQYDINGTFEEPNFQLDIGKGAAGTDVGDVGIEQFYTRFDPRFNLLFVSWQWFKHPYFMGSNPFLYSDDFGATWRSADGSAIDDLPLDYTEINDIIVPFDHLGQFNHTGWNPSDIGVAPDGTFWMTSPVGIQVPGPWYVKYWFFDGEQWNDRQLTGQMLSDSKPHAVGVTQDYLVFAYSDNDHKDQLLVRISDDGGDTWSDARIVDDAISDTRTINWVSFAQPADDYEDNCVRFFYAYFRDIDSVDGKRYLNNIRWIKLDVAALFNVHDITGDGYVDVNDLLALFEAWGACPDCPADVNGDGVVDAQDLLELIANWSPPA
jgi:hypothetical protein